MIFELLKGGCLVSKIRSSGKYSEEKAAKIMKQLLEVLIYLEENQIIHRDIKLQNLILADDFDDVSIKLIDFGLAVKISNISYGNACGTPGFIAPEMLRAEKYHYKVDVFSSGVILYTL